MLKSLSKANRTRALLLLATCVVLAVAASVVGIEDNLVGISAATLSATALVLALVHHWRSSVQFRRLIYASILGGVVFVLLANALLAVIEFTQMPGALDRLLEVAATAFFLVAGFLCVPGLLAGTIGAIAAGIWERRQGGAA
jgi:hypothetical protein